LKTKIKDIFNREELSVYDAADLLAVSAKIIIDLNDAVLFHHEDIGEQACELVDRAKEAGKKYLEAYDILMAAEIKATNAADELFNPGDPEYPAEWVYDEKDITSATCTAFEKAI